jgi:hypothetical protein
MERGREEPPGVSRCHASWLNNGTRASRSHALGQDKRFNCVPRLHVCARQEPSGYVRPLYREHIPHLNAEYTLNKGQHQDFGCCEMT